MKSRRIFFKSFVATAMLPVAGSALGQTAQGVVPPITLLLFEDQFLTSGVTATFVDIGPKEQVLTGASGDCSISFSIPQGLA